ncbi:MAG: DUF370 domain-containing protein [Clostridiales bacterium]|nr:DUF370 domain-containing protein [Clostridiales bacterium]
MYLHLGNGVLVDEKDVIGIFDLEITSQSYRTRQYLNRAEKNGHVTYVDIEELPKSFVVCASKGQRQTVYLSPLASQTLQRRSARRWWEENELLAISY